MKVNETLKIHALASIANMKVHGRTTGARSPLALFWTGSGIECNAKGSELWVEVEVDYDSYEPWISIVINGVPVSRQMLTAGRYWVCVFRGMNENVTKNVRIVRDVQAMSGDPDCYLLIHAVKFDGEFLPVEEKPYKLEFIGDSITSGEGAIGATAEEDWISMWFSALHNYTAMTAEAVNAEYRVISQSGWGVLTSWDNNPHANIPDNYEKVCGVLTGQKNEALGALDDNDFERWQPDIVVVNLGTNDGGAFHSPAWEDEATGRTYKQRLNEDGTYHKDDLTVFEGAAANFLIKLRKYNPEAHLVWAYGMLGTPMLPAINRAIELYMKRSGDQKVTVVELPNMIDETVGARSHPGRLAHEWAAQELSAHIKEILAKN
ncbi:MAG: SGNH/GDSL hydrolase family protein [Candidatus Cohnella colombiensis]|uniref:SGNH/GDSL hydrolase family protein n=1 Tax=Candidatus Cohnella colombiensis TaxID=3121368 RepID=A0AA95EW94_9BACL|nr:MAG: SGNH/GDSL hydrolase family protein [Cohnella sp.]